MIKDLTRLMDGKYFFVNQEGETRSVFYGSRLELLVYLSDYGFSDAEISLIVQVLDSTPSVKAPANRQGYC